MKTGLRSGLFWVDVLVLLAVLAVLALPSGAIRIILGVPFVLFFPGFTLLIALFPRRDNPSGLERAALSVGLSIAVVPLIGLALNYTPWGIRLNPILLSISIFTLAMSSIAWWRESRLPKEERFTVRLGPLFTWPQGKWDRVVYTAMIVIIIGSVATVGYLIAHPKTGEPFTEFYILGPAGEAADYPKEVRLGSSASVVVGVINNLKAPATYSVTANISGVKNGETSTFTLAPKEKHEEPLQFTPTATGTDQPVEFILYKDGQIDPSLKPLRLWIDVVP